MFLIISWLKIPKIKMKTKIVVVLVSLFQPILLFSQIERMPLKGQVRNDLVPVENVIVLM
jgi:hypothetical protein